MPVNRNVCDTRPRCSSGPVSETARRAAAGAFVSLAALGLFTSLAPTFLAGTLHHTSHALAALPAFTAFLAAVTAQIAAGSWDLRRLLATGIATLSAGL